MPYGTILQPFHGLMSAVAQFGFKFGFLRKFQILINMIWSNIFIKTNEICHYVEVSRKLQKNICYEEMKGKSFKKKEFKGRNFEITK